MKLESAGHFLRDLRNQPLIEITQEDVNDACQHFQVIGQPELCDSRSFTTGIASSYTSPIGYFQNGSQPASSTKNGFENFKTPLLPSLQKTPLFSAMYKTPLVHKTPLFSSQMTPLCYQSLINLTFSQPSTPRTPLMKQMHSYGTPFMLNEFYGTPGSCFVPSTPMLLDPLKVFDSNSFTRNFCNGTPDILQLIDNDRQTLEDVNHQMMQYTEAPLNDNNLVDYLLDVSNDYTVLQSHDKQKQSIENDEDLLKCKRKCARAKPMTKEEKESIQRLNKEKMKEERKRKKEKFKKRTYGSRRSTRHVKKVKYF